jgi:hypothetical protein
MQIRAKLILHGCFILGSLNGFAGIITNASIDTSAPVKISSPYSLIYRGAEYAKVYTSISGNPFFRDLPVNGWVDYYQNRYENIPIRYDMEDDQVIFHEPLQQISISLVNDKVDGFMIDGHHFIALRDLTGFRGFYEELYTGKRLVLVKWQKTLVRRVNEEGKYISYSYLYIQEGSTLTGIQNKKDLFAYFGNNKKKMQQFYHDQHLDFKKDPMHTAVVLTEFAESNGW